MRELKRNMYNTWIVVSIATIIIQSMIVVYENDYSLPNMVHVIGWTLWLIVIFLLRAYKS
jgi:hypothetical protein